MVSVVRRRGRPPVKLNAVSALVVVFLVAGVATTVAHATVQEESCIEPDVEYPVPCDDDED